MCCARILAPMLSIVGMVLVQNAETACTATKGEEDSFVSLFDGKTLNGWQGDVANYAVKDGVMICHGKNIFTMKEYANFILRFEFKLPPGANNGIGIRTPATGRISRQGMEIQILDDSHPKHKNIAPYQAHGSIYGVTPARRGFLKPAGQWNRQEIRADGSRITVTLNGVVITDVDLAKIHEPLDGNPHPGLHNSKGHIALLGHGKKPDPVAFRALRIRELP
jgi:hypothetical protein